jgi:hypothetical protein
MAQQVSWGVLGAAVPAWPIEDALATLRTIEAIFAAARHGSWQAVGH